MEVNKLLIEVKNPPVFNSKDLLCTINIITTFYLAKNSILAKTNRSLYETISLLSSSSLIFYATSKLFPEKHFALWD